MSSQSHDEQIAVIGMSCRFPGARDYREYWRNLAAGVESITALTEDRLRESGAEEWKIKSPDWVRAAAVIDGIDGFDARFFGYTAREAEIRDPQQRLFLETCYGALEDGGYDTERYGGIVSVFGGTGENEYRYRVDRNAEAWQAMGRVAIEVANGAGYLTTSVSHRLNLRGPSVSVQTACSTSLVAVHLASQSLRAGECDLALAGGVEIPLSCRHGYLWTEGGIDSRDGHCRAFDADASGTVFGAGAGVVLLKRLADARADGDHIYAVVRGSAVNNDGAARTGFTAPGAEGQTRLVASALAAAGITPDSIGYVEAHGTGTLVGDPVELAALTRAFRAGGDQSRGRCLVGSVKPNVGHLGAAAGVAGLIKVCLTFQQEAIPPSINFERPNPRIDFEGSPFAVNTRLRSWPRGDAPRRAGISSFGIGGTNAHVVLEEPPLPAPPAAGRRRWHVLPVSAKTEAALETATQRLADHFAASEGGCARAAYTLQTGRRQLPYRRAVVAGTAEEAGSALAAARGAEAAPARSRTVTYLFPGQGSQYPGMGAGLYETEPVFRAAIDRCAELLAPRLSADLRSVLFPADVQSQAAASQLRQTQFAQPALFTVEYAVAEVLRARGIVPEAMIGHSVGEWVAAHLAGVFSLPDALTLVAKRGQLMQSMAPGTMLAVPLSEQELAELLSGDVEIAAVNAPDLVVVSGPVSDVDRFRDGLSALGVQAVPLHTSHAFHSRSMEPILAEFGEAVAAAERSAPAVPVVSNVTGTWVTPEQATDPGYWVRQLREPVRFAEGIRMLGEQTDRLLLEVGPGASLTSLATRALGSNSLPAVTTMPGPRRAAGDDRVLAEAVGRLWVAGVSPDWGSYWAEGAPGRTPLPEYPFERRRYWLDPDVQPAGDQQADNTDQEPEVLGVGEATFSVRWQECSLAPATASPLAPRWLLLSSGRQELDGLRDRLVAGGAQVSVAVAGSEFRQLAEDRFTVRPAEPEDLGRLLAAVAAVDGLPSRIVHGFSMTEAVADPVAPEAVAETSELGFYSLLHLAQEVAKRRGDRDVELFAVSSNLQDVTGTEVLEPGKAMLLGPSLLAGLELPGVRCRSVDFALPSPLPPATMADQLLAELTGGDGVSRVAWRGYKRWVWGHEPLPLTEPAGVPAALRERGVYLVTGGLGAVGLFVAKELARLVGARLVLIGRTAVPAREQWPDLLADPVTPRELRERLEQLQEIEAAGGELMIRACDVTDEAQLSAVVEEAVARFGAVHGAFHSAGVAGGGMLAVRSRADAERVLAPKVAGTLTLHRVLTGRVDFLVLFSSSAAVVGDFGLVDYVAANNFQDAFARRAAARGEPVYSIGWAVWQDGMGALVDYYFPTFRELPSHRSEPAEHPLLDRRIYDDSGDIVFSTVLQPGSHWIINDHSVGEVPVVPGSALVEMIRAGYAMAVGGPVELREVVFIGPIAVAGPTELRLVLRPEGGGFDATVVAGRPNHAGTDRAKAKVVPASGDAAPTHDLAALAARCDRGSLEIKLPPDGLVRFGEHWHNVGTVQVGDGEELARLALDGRFHAECQDYVLHPGLFDDAVSNSRVLPMPDAGLGGILPLSYGRIVVHAALPPAFLVHVRHLDAGDGQQVASDITLIDDHGQELVRVDRYLCRRVDPGSVQADLASHAADLASAGSRAGASASAPAWAISESTGMDALRRILHHLPKPHLVVSPEGLERYLRRVERLTGDQLAREVAEALPAGSSDDRVVDTPYAAPENELQGVLATLLQKALGVPRLGIDDDFFELGGNSLVAVQFGFRLRELLEVEVPIASLLDLPTVRGLSVAVDKLLREKAAATREEEDVAVPARP